MNQTNGQPLRHTSRQASKVIHELWRPRIDVDHRAADTRLRIAAILGVVVFIAGLIIGDQAGRPAVMGIGAALGIVTFTIALAKASSHYKRGYRRFVVEHMADDGTFLFCPNCKAPLGDPDDPHVKTEPPTACHGCGTNPWRFEFPVENPKHAARRNPV